MTTGDAQIAVVLDDGPNMPARGMVRRVLGATFTRTGAVGGLIWIVLLVLLAVFAPLLANSHPILMSRDGTVSSPLLSHLTAVDITLLVAFFSALLLAGVRWLMRAFKSRLSQSRFGAPGVMTWITIVALTGLVAWWMVPPRYAQVLSQYREAQVAGELDWAILAPIPYSPTDRQRDSLSATNIDPRLLLPSPAHWMGTTADGEDVASRMIHASRIALAIGMIATGIALVLGVTIGGLMGYFSGWVDLLGMRLVEVFSAIPVIFLLIMIVAFYGRSLYLMMVILGLTGWVGYAVYVRAEFLKLRNTDFVVAARALGLPLWSVLFRHMLPNGITPVLVLASFSVAGMILTESTLSFLGLGLVEEPSWGQLLNQARSAGSQWGLVVFPGLAIFLTVLAYNLIGEALRDALDPHAQRSSMM